MKLDFGRILGWVLPLLAMAIAAFFVVQERAKLELASQDLTIAQREEANASAAKELADRQSGRLHFAAAPNTPSEEPKFLDGIQKHAKQAGVRIVKWSARPITPTPAGTEGEQEKPAAIKSIITLKGDLTVSGPYDAVRKFLLGLSRSNRLYTFSDLHWTRTPTSTVELSCTVGRYVDPTMTAPETTVRAADPTSNL